MHPDHRFSHQRGQRGQRGHKAHGDSCTSIYFTRKTSFANNSEISTTCSDVAATVYQLDGDMFGSTFTDHESALQYATTEGRAALQGTNTHILYINFFFRWFRFSLWT
jgi:hypothetical protein